MNVVALVHLNVAIGNFRNVLVAQRYRIVKHHEEIGKQRKGIL
jgi:hypothetical protein